MNVVNAILETLSKNPELIKLAGKLVPNNVTIAGGGGGGLDLTSALAVFGGQMQQSVGKLPTNTQRTHVRKK